MRRLYYIIQKEFIQIFRNKAILPLMTVVPIMQLIVLSFAATNEVKDVQLAIVNHAPSSYTRQLIQKISVSDRFIMVGILNSQDQADQMMQEGKADVVLSIPPNFEKNFFKTKKANLQLLVNAINGQQATVGASYISQIIQSFNKEIRVENLQSISSIKRNVPNIRIVNSHWYNPELDYKYFMVPGIMGELVTILVMLLTAMNIVREREIGTIEQINVTPIKKWQFILGKMIPFLLIGMILLTVGLTVGKIIFDVPIRGNLAVVFAYCFINLTAVLGLGLFISNMSNTQQQAMFTTFFFVIVFILMSGLFTPIESMPKTAQYFTIPNPIAHFVNVMRAVLLKGSGFFDVLYEFQVTAVLAAVFNTLAIWSYRKVS
jgi:ABC-2 type transport system permease protein